MVEYVIYFLARHKNHTPGKITKASTCSFVPKQGLWIKNSPEIV